jgi:hypothetical protein
MDVERFVSRQALEAEPSPVYAIDRAGRVAYVNGAWDRVASEAGGPDSSTVVGSSWIEAIAGDELRAFYGDLFARVLARRAGERHPGECNTPDRYRLFSNRYEPLACRGEEPSGLLVVTTLLEDAPVGERYPTAPLDERAYRQPSGLVLQCSGCRRVHVVGTSPRAWCFVPEYVALPPRQVTHGLCEVCRALHYGVRC